MEFTDAWYEAKPRLMTKADSFVILQDPMFAPSDRSSYASVAMTPTAFKNRGPDQPLPSDAISIDIALRRGRIAALTMIVVGTIVWLVLVFEKGYEIKWSDTEHLSSEKRKQVLDEYNSFTGNVASIFGKPIELFVAACVQVILLRFVSASMLRNEPSWKAVYSALALSAIVGYLINNGFNSLNVQFVDSDISLAIEPSDLARNDDVIAGLPDWKSHTTSITHSMSETQAHNPITNTVLRGLVLPRALRSKSACEKMPTQTGLTSPRFPLDNVEFGFPQRDWMKQLLTKALPEASLELVLNPTNASANAGVRSRQLPMQAAVAAQLVLHAMEMAHNYIPLADLDDDGSDKRDDNDETDTNDDQASGSGSGTDFQSEREYVEPSTLAANILPDNQSASDAEQKEWFAKHVNGVIANIFGRNSIMWVGGIPAKFSHVDVAPNISFDAVTLEIEVPHRFLTELTDKKTGTRYVNSEKGLAAGADNRSTFNCDPWPARCVFKKGDPPFDADSPKLLDIYDAPAQVHAFSMCLNENGTENIYPASCTRTSTTSLLLISVGKRIVVDELIQNATANSAGLHRSNKNVATNLRKIYSFMVSRLSWTTTDLAAAFGATCNPEAKDCQGLVVELQPPSDQGSTPQHLLVSADALPIDALMQLNLAGGNFTFDIQRPVTLVQVNEPPRQPTRQFWYDVLAGDCDGVARFFP